MWRKNTAIFFVFCVFLIISGGCASLPKDYEKSVSYAFKDTEGTTLGKALSGELEVRGETSGFYLLGNGLDAFAARGILSARAERSIDLQYFLYHSDLVGKLLTDQLIKAADRGVRIRILLDDIGMGGRDLITITLDSHPNIEIRLLNPFVRNHVRTLQFLTRYSHATRRMHNKSFTVDNQATILGGRNIGNEYFNADEHFSFADLDVLAIGPVVKDVSEEFDLYWNCELAYPVSVLSHLAPAPDAYHQKKKELTLFAADQQDSPYMVSLQNSDLVKKFKTDQIQFAWGKYDLIYDQPEKLVHKKSEKKYHLSTKLKPYLEQVEKELILFSPYFIPGIEGVETLALLCKRGVRVKILTNSLASTNHAIVHAGYSKYRKKMLRAGIELYELNVKLNKEDKKAASGLSKAGLHAKSFIFDRNKIFVGSLDLDPVALYNNTEMGVVITQDEIAREMGNWFDANIDELAFRLELIKDKNGFEQIRWNGYEKGKPVTFTKDPYSDFWTRFGVGFMRIFPIDSFL